MDLRLGIGGCLGKLRDRMGQVACGSEVQGILVKLFVKLAQSREELPFLAHTVKGESKHDRFPPNQLTLRCLFNKAIPQTSCSSFNELLGQVEKCVNEIFPGGNFHCKDEGQREGKGCLPTSFPFWKAFTNA